MNPQFQTIEKEYKQKLPPDFDYGVNEWKE